MRDVVAAAPASVRRGLNWLAPDFMLREDNSRGGPRHAAASDSAAAARAASPALDTTVLASSAATRASAPAHDMTVLASTAAARVRAPPAPAAPDAAPSAAAAADAAPAAADAAPPPPFPRVLPVCCSSHMAAALHPRRTPSADGSATPARHEHSRAEHRAVVAATLMLHHRVMTNTLAPPLATTSSSRCSCSIDTVTADSSSQPPLPPHTFMPHPDYIFGRYRHRPRYLPFAAAAPPPPSIDDALRTRAREAQRGYDARLRQLPLGGGSGSGVEGELLLLDGGGGAAQRLCAVPTDRSPTRRGVVLHKDVVTMMRLQVCGVWRAEAFLSPPVPVGVPRSASPQLTPAALNCRNALHSDYHLCI